MNRPSRFTKFKIVVGYLFLLATMFAALYFIHREIEQISVTEEQEGLKTDSLMTLLRQKDESAMMILKNLAAEYDSIITTTNSKMEKIIPIKKSIIGQERVQQTEVITRDSTHALTTKKSFFKRLAEAFVPPKDTAVVTTTRQEINKDTLIRQFQIEDSIHEEIRVLNEKRQIRNVAALQRNNKRLVEINKLLTARIDTLVTQYEESVEEQAEKEALAYDDMVKRSTDFLSKLAFVAVILVFLFLIIIWRDINKGNRYRRQIEEANQRAEALLEAREKLMLTITHDFRTPLNSIIGYSQLLLGEVEDKEHRTYLSNMKTSGIHLLDLVNNLLEFHKLDLQKEEAVYDVFNPWKLFNDIGLSFEPLATEKKIKLKYTIDPALKGAYKSDARHLRQLTVNLLSNAVKFTDKGTASLAVALDGDQLVVRVSDTGPGMTAEEKVRMFGEFTRLANAQGKEGSGLGLTIVNKLTNLMNGSLEVESEPGKGTTFVVVLPIEKVDQIIEEEADADKVEKKSLKLKVIMIDDDPMQLELASTMLKYQGATVTACLTVEELIRKLQEDTYDVLMTDVQMPAVNGFDLIKLLRASNIEQAQRIPLVAVTGSCDLPEEQFFSNGFYGYLAKPFTTNDLLVALDVNKTVELARVEQMSRQNKLPMDYYAKYFVEKLREDISKLKEALNKKNAEGIVMTAHQMLPNLIMVRARQITPSLAYLNSLKGFPFSKRMGEEAQRILDGVAEVLKAAEGEFGEYL